MKAHFSISYTLEADPKTITQIEQCLNEALVGQVKDLLAQTLSGLEFDLQQRYWLFNLDRDDPEVQKRMRQFVPIWSSEQNAFVSVEVGSPEWFELVEKVGKFFYTWQGLKFTVKQETRKSKGKDYTYWRAYATVGRKLRTKQLGSREKLTKENLDAVGAFFGQFL